MTDCSDDKKFEEALESLDFIASLGMGILCVNLKGENTVEENNTTAHCMKCGGDLSKTANAFGVCKCFYADQLAKTKEPEETIDSLTEKLADSEKEVDTLRGKFREIIAITDMLRASSRPKLHRGIGVSKIALASVLDLAERFQKVTATADSLADQLATLRKERDELAKKLADYDCIPSEIDSSSGIVSMSRADYDALMKDLADCHNAIPCPTTDDGNVVIAKDEWEAKNKHLAELMETESKLILQIEEINDSLSSSFRENNSLRRLADTLEKSVEYLKVIHAQEMMLASAESAKKCVHESCATACLAEEISLIDNMEQD